VHQGVRPEQVADALSALAQIPLADRILLAQAGLVVDLMPDARFEHDMVGATQVEKDASGRWHPQSIRVATGAGLQNSPTRHIVAHEVGHAIAVMRTQDRSELAAEQYCMRVLTSPADQAIAAARMRAEGMNPAGVTARTGVAAAALAACLLRR
jgi:hypothetical protein